MAGAALTESEILRALYALGIEDGYRDASSYGALIATATRPMPSEDALRVALRPTRSSLRRRAARLRLDAETRGVMHADIAVPTDPERLALMSLSALRASREPDSSVAFTDADENVFLLSAQTFLDLALAADRHVQACRLREAEALRGILTGAIATEADVDAVFANPE